MITDMLYLFPGLDFTVNTAVTEVNVTWPVVPGTVYGEFINSTAPLHRYFQPKDNMTILSYGVKLPYCFNYSKHVAYFTFAWFQDPVIANVSEISPPTAKLNTPLPNHEHEINTYIPFGPPDPTLEASLGIISGLISLSMVGVPDDLNTEVLQVYPFIKVKHNIEMGA